MHSRTLVPTIQGVQLDDGPEAFAEPRRSCRDEPATTLARRLSEDGYLFLPAFFADAAAAAARSTDGNQALADLLYGAETMAFFDRVLSGACRHFDFTWTRAMGPGMGTAPHCDTVFMGRGTPDVVTMWTALMDIPVDLGGLAILEGSHRDHESLRTYRRLDVDTYCENFGEVPVASMGDGGSLPCADANALRRQLRSRWVWTDYRAGDVFIFGLMTVHASLDNQSRKVRLSTDSRYQLASEPIDERWFGEEPIAHGLEAQRPSIC
jgi:hypothetical protein